MMGTMTVAIPRSREPTRRARGQVAKQHTQRSGEGPGEPEAEFIPFYFGLIDIDGHLFIIPVNWCRSKETCFIVTFQSL